jgi:hypothetical protein
MGCKGTIEVCTIYIYIYIYMSDVQGKCGGFKAANAVAHKRGNYDMVLKNNAETHLARFHSSENL